MKNLKQTIEAKIKEKGYTKSLIYSSIGMTRVGFEKALENESLKLKDFEQVVNFLSIEPNFFFDYGKEYSMNTVEEPPMIYNAKKKNDTKTDTNEEIIFLRSQVKQLTGIIETLSKQIDTNNIK